MPLTDVGKLLLATVEQAVARPDYVGFARVEMVDEGRQEFAQLVVDHGFVGTGLGVAGDQVAERRVAVLVDRGVEADVLAAPRHQVEDPVELHAELGGDLLGLRVAAELTLQGAAGAADLVELLDDVDREAYDEFRRDWPEARPFGLDKDSRHSPVYLDMTELVPDEAERNRLISGCDINQHWSAMIGVFRGQLRGYFCEIAGAQAMLKQIVAEKWLKASAVFARLVNGVRNPWLSA